jgi:porin
MGGRHRSRTANELVSTASALLLSLGALQVEAGNPRDGTAPAEETRTEGHSRLPGEYPEHRYRSAFPSPTATEHDEFEDKYLTADWLGARSQLARLGLKVSVLIITDPFGNVLGGRERGFTDYNLVGGDLVFESGPLVGWEGGEFHSGMAANFGASLSRSYVGNSFPVQLADVADPYFRLTYLSYTQSLFDGGLSLRAGRLTINSVYGEEFLGSEYFKAFTSVGINLVPIGIFLAAPGAFGYPDTTWGARVKVEPVEQFYAMAGAYNGDPQLKEGRLHGVDFSLRGPAFLIAEIGLRGNYGKNTAGLSGNLKLGGYYDDGPYGFYLVGDQELLRWGDATQGRHLGAFAALTFTPDWDANTVPLFFDAGLVLYGPAEWRPKDSVGFAVAGAAHRAGQFELTFEWNYGLRLLPGLLLQPDIQTIVRPGGNPSVSNALVLGLNVVVNL